MIEDRFKVLGTCVTRPDLPLIQSSCVVCQDYFAGFDFLKNLVCILNTLADYEFVKFELTFQRQVREGELCFDRVMSDDKPGDPLGL